MSAGDPLDRLRLARALHPLGGSALTAEPSNQSEIADLALSPPAEAAVLLALIERGRAPTVLFTRRTRRLSRHAGQVSLPGGRVDPDDAGVVEAALREANEEVGLAAGLVDPVGLLDPYLTVTGFRIVPVVGLVQPFRPRLDPGEVEEAFEVPLAALLEPGAFQRCSARWRGRVRHYFEFHHGGHRIWGATAAIMINLRERLAAQ